MVQTAFDFARTQQDATHGRHHGNSQSKAANRRASQWKSVDREGIARLVRSAGACGLTSLDIEQMLGIPKNRFSGRITELKAQGVLQVVGARDGCGVLVHRDCRLGGAA